METMGTAPAASTRWRSLATEAVSSRCISMATTTSSARKQTRTAPTTRTGPTTTEIPPADGELFVAGRRWEKGWGEMPQPFLCLPYSQSAWKGNSKKLNFRFTAFSEVGRLRRVAHQLSQKLKSFVVLKSRT